MSIGRFRRIRFASTAAAVMILAVPCCNVAHADDISTKVDQSLNNLLPAKLKEAGTIRVASNVEYPPFEYYDTDNTTIIGLDRDLADAIGQKLGV